MELILNNNKLSDNLRSKKQQKILGELDNYQLQISILSGVSSGISQLAKSGNTYTYNTVEPGTIYLSSNIDGTVIINNDGTTGNRVYETVHAVQYDNGAMCFKPIGTNNILYIEHPTKLEFEAYLAQYSTTGILPHSDNSNPRSIFDINLNWIYGLRDVDGYYPYRSENYES